MKRKSTEAFLVNEDFFDNLSAQSAWFLGLMAADGNVTKDLKRFKISQSGPEGFKLIEHIVRMLDFKGNVSTYKNAHSVQITSRKLVSRLVEYGIIPNKSTVLEFPKNLPLKYAKPFIRGYFDGDGSVGVYVNKNNSRFLIASVVGTRSFIRDLKKHVSAFSSCRQIARCKNLFEIRWNGKLAIAFCQWLFDDSPIYSSYKSIIFKSYIKSRKDQFTKYSGLKKDSLALLECGFDGVDVAEIVGVPFQTVYKWRKKCATI